MNQKIEDLKLIVKNDRRIWAAGAFIVIVVILFTFATKKAAQPKIAFPTADKKTGRMVDDKDAVKELISAFRGRLDENESKTRDTASNVESLKRNFEGFENRTTAFNEGLLDEIESLQKRVDTALSNLPPPGGAPGTGGKEDLTAEATPPDEVERIFGGDDDIPLGPQKPVAPVAPKRVTVISPGDSVKVRLLSGVAAPVDGTPYPVVLSIEGPIMGPDGSSLEVGEGRIVAAATGSQTDGRVQFRLTSLSMRLPDGSRSVLKVDGWLVGEDGVKGMTGKVKDKFGQLILATLGVSAANAYANDVVDNAQDLDIENNTGDVFVSDGTLDKVLASSLNDTTKLITQALIDKYQKLVPVVEVLSNRESVAVFSSATEVNLCGEDCDSPGYTTASLD